MSTSENSPKTPAARHRHKVSNMLDPRVDYNAPQASPGPDTSPTHPPQGDEGWTTTTTTTETKTTYTPGPHASSLANRLDPRVDNETGEVSGDPREGTSGARPVIPPKSERRMTPSPVPPENRNQLNAGGIPDREVDSTPRRSSRLSKRNPNATPLPPNPPSSNRPQVGSFPNGNPHPGHTTTMPNGAANNTLNSDTNQNFSRPIGVGQGLKTAVAGVHGAGETLRGTFNAAVARAANEDPARHDAIAQSGRQEIDSGRIGEEARAREEQGRVGRGLGRLGSAVTARGGGPSKGRAGRRSSGTGTELERVEEGSRLL